MRNRSATQIGSTTVLMLAILLLIGCTSNVTELNDTTNSENEGETDTNINNEGETDTNINNEGDTGSLESWVPDEEVTVSILYPWGEGAFEERYGPVADALENISLELIPALAVMDELEAINAQGIIPDIIFPEILEDMQELDMLYPLDELVERHNFDLSVIEESSLAHIRARDPEGRLTGLPFAYEPFVLFYNKTIFDQFGQSYPDNDLTWSDTLDLAATLTREEDGVDYVGLELGPGSASGPVNVPLQQFAINLTDPESGEVQVRDLDEVSKYYELMEQLYGIPGIYDPEFAETGQYAFAEGRAAMLVAWGGYPRWGLSEDMYEQIDIASLPVWEHHPYSPPMSVNQHVIHPLSENKDAAFKVITEYLSEEHQARMARTVVEGTVLTDRDVALQFGQEHPAYQHDINIDALYDRTPALPPDTLSYWDRYVDVAGMLPRLAEGMSTVEVMRELEEESEQKIVEAMEAGN